MGFRVSWGIGGGFRRPVRDGVWDLGPPGSHDPGWWRASVVLIVLHTYDHAHKAGFCPSVTHLNVIILVLWVEGEVGEVTGLWLCRVWKITATKGPENTPSTRKNLN